MRLDPLVHIAIMQLCLHAERPQLMTFALLKMSCPACIHNKRVDVIFSLVLHAHMPAMLTPI